MFKFNPNARRRVMYPVTLQLIGDGGEPAPVTFNMGFVLMNRDEYQAWFKKDFDASAENTEGGEQGLDALFASLRKSLSDEALSKRDTEIRAHCYDWDVVDENEEPVQFSDDNLRALMNMGTAYALAVEQAWLDACRDAPVKNS